MSGWVNANLAVQGYCLSAEQTHALRWGLRLPTGLCLAVVEIATVWLAAVAALFAAGATTMALLMGWLLIGVCSLVTVTNYCIPSTLLAIWRRRRGNPAPA